MPSRKINRRNKSDSAHVQKKWKNKHSSHLNNNRIKQGYYGTSKSLKPVIKEEKKHQKKKLRMWYNTINNKLVDESIPISSTTLQNELEIDDSDNNAYIDRYQDIPIWNCPICSYKNIEKHLFCSICNHPYSRKSQEITISEYIKYPNHRKLKNNMHMYKKQKTKLINKISVDCIKNIICAKTGLPHNKIEVNPLLNKFAMPRLLRKYYQYQNKISLVFMTQEIIPDYDFGDNPFADRWQCQFCGKRNPKIYVFCERCFLTPRLDEISNKPEGNGINSYAKQAALDDPIIQFCGLRTLVYGYCEIYSSHKLHTDIIDLVAAYYQLYNPDIPIGDILPFNQHDLSQCNDLDVYVMKRNEMITCNSIESLDLYIENMRKWRRRHKNIYICLLFMKPDNEWPKYTLFQHLLPIYKIKFKISGILSYAHQFSDSKGFCENLSNLKYNQLSLQAQLLTKLSLW